MKERYLFSNFYTLRVDPILEKLPPGRQQKSKQKDNDQALIQSNPKPHSQNQNGKKHTHTN